MIGLLKKLVPGQRERNVPKWSMGSKRQQGFMDTISEKSEEFHENAESFDVLFKSGMAMTFALRDPVMNERAARDELYVTHLNLNDSSIADISVRKDFRDVCLMAERSRVDLSVTLSPELTAEQQETYTRFLLTAGFDQFISVAETGQFIRPHQPQLRRA